MSCLRTPEEEGKPCPDPKKHSNPILETSDPRQLDQTDPGVLALFNKICPFMDPTQPVCCTEDQVYIMEANFQQIDSVFGQDVPMCGVDQKKQWCEYTCSPR